MGRSDRVGGPVVGSMAVVALALVLAAPIAGAATKTASSGSTGWVVDKARFESIDPATPLTVDGKDYRGAMEVNASAGGVSTINEVSLDDYVGGISEVPPTWPPEALKAQAIAARSYALNRKAQSPVSAPYRQAGADICNTDSCQVYGGVAKEQQQAGSNWTAAVKATAGQVVLYNGAPIFAEYSSSNGGRTVAGSFPYLKSVSDPDDAASPLHHWHYSMPLAALSGVLGVSSPAVLVSANRSNDRLVYQVRQAPPPTTPQSSTTGTTAPPTTTTTTKPGQQPAPAPAPTTPTTPPTTAPPPTTTQTMAMGDFISKANGSGLPIPGDLPMAFPSDRFSVSSSGDTVTIDGGGYGHGVGMSQWGAYGKARRGMKASDILAAYYGGLRPTTLPPDQLPPTIRVALGVGEGSTTVTAPGRFRVLDGTGKPLALIALGKWTMTPAGGGKVRVVPPEGYDKPLSITSGAIDPPAVSAGVPAAIHYKLSTPAVVKLTLAAPGAAPVTIDAGVLDAGETVQPLPPAAMGGAYQVVIDADAGPDRQASLPVVFSVAGPARLVVPSASMLAAPHGQALLTRAATVWRSFPARFPLSAAALLLLINAVFLGMFGVRKRRAAPSRVD